MTFNPLHSILTLKKLVLVTAIAFSSVVSPVLAESVKIKSLGHSSLLIKGGGYSVLLNPFKAVGCAARLKEPNVSADVILASSELLDEGAKNAKGVFFVKPGSYRFRNLNLEGFTTFHDRVQGRRYGMATMWQWKQAGLNFVHLGGNAGSLNEDYKLSIGRPDILFIAVGGGAKVYNGYEAAKIVNDLNPKIIIPVQYVRGSSSSSCDQTNIEPFLDAMKGIQVRKSGKTLVIRSNLPDKKIINLMP